MSDHPADVSTRERAHDLDRHLFLVVLLVLLLIVGLMIVSLVFQLRAYSHGLELAVNHGQPNHAAIIVYARSLDTAIAKSSAIFLGFLLVFTGALYVLRQSRETYKLTAEVGRTKSNLESSSPGLVMITLGVALIAITLFVRKDFEYTATFNTDVPSGGQHANQNNIPSNDVGPLPH